jgi:hypothetical protein
MGMVPRRHWLSPSGRQLQIRDGSISATIDLARFAPGAPPVPPQRAPIVVDLAASRGAIDEVNGVRYEIAEGVLRLLPASAADLPVEIPFGRTIAHDASELIEAYPHSVPGIMMVKYRWGLILVRLRDRRTLELEVHAGVDAIALVLADGDSVVDVFPDDTPLFRVRDASGTTERSPRKLRLAGEPDVIQPPVSTNTHASSRTRPNFQCGFSAAIRCRTQRPARSNASMGSGTSASQNRAASGRRTVRTARANRSTQTGSNGGASA